MNVSLGLSTSTCKKQRSRLLRGEQGHLHIVRGCAITCQALGPLVQAAIQWEALVLTVQIDPSNSVPLWPWLCAFHWELGDQLFIILVESHEAKEAAHVVSGQHPRVHLHCALEQLVLVGAVLCPVGFLAVAQWRAVVFEALGQEHQDGHHTDEQPSKELVREEAGLREGPRATWTLPVGGRFCSVGKQDLLLIPLGHTLLCFLLPFYSSAPRVHCHWTPPNPAQELGVELSDGVHESLPSTKPLQTVSSDAISKASQASSFVVAV